MLEMGYGKEQQLHPLGNIDLPIQGNVRLVAEVSQTVSALQGCSRSGSSQTDIPYKLPITNTRTLQRCSKNTAKATIGAKPLLQGERGWEDDLSPSLRGASRPFDWMRF